MNHRSKIYVAGHKGLVGNSIIKELEKKGFKKIIIATRDELDLTNQKEVLKFLKKNKPNFIFIAAAKVGGIYSNNKFPADFIHNNLTIQTVCFIDPFIKRIQSFFAYKPDVRSFLQLTCVRSSTTFANFDFGYIASSTIS